MGLSKPVLTPDCRECLLALGWTCKVQTNVAHAQLPPPCSHAQQEAVRSLKGDLAQSEGGATHVVHPMGEGVSLDDSQRYARVMEVRWPRFCGCCCCACCRCPPKS